MHNFRHPGLRRGTVLHLLMPHLQSGALVSLLDPLRPQEEPIWAAYPQRRHLLPKVRLLIDKLREELPGPCGGAGRSKSPASRHLRAIGQQWSPDYVQPFDSRIDQFVHFGKRSLSCLHQIASAFGAKEAPRVRILKLPPGLWNRFRGADRNPPITPYRQGQYLPFARFECHFYALFGLPIAMLDEALNCRGSMAMFERFATTLQTIQYVQYEGAIGPFEHGCLLARKAGGASKHQADLNTPPH
jgi:hypothetical protein